MSLQTKKSAGNHFLFIFLVKDLAVMERKCTFALAFVKTEAKRKSSLKRLHKTEK